MTNLYMLDTNMCIYLMKNQPLSVGSQFKACHVGDVVMSAITFAKLMYGVSVSSNSEQAQASLDELINLIEVLPFNGNAARANGPVQKATREKKTDYLDKLIASHTISVAAIHVTNNEKDFSAHPQ